MILAIIKTTLAQAKMIDALDSSRIENQYTSIKRRYKRSYLMHAHLLKMKTLDKRLY